MHAITPFGMFHTVISVIAVGAGAVAFARDKRINPGNATGKTYIWATVFTCVTGFFIFHDTGHFGPPHALGIITLAVLGLAAIAGKGIFGSASRYVEMICYSMTFFFHMIPTITEGLTRLPPGAPIAASQNAPLIQEFTAVAFVLFLVGVRLQLGWMRKRP